VLVQTITDCVPNQVGAGGVVFIPAGVAHRVANVSDHDAEAVATYTLPVGLAVRDDAPAACVG
jgi:quercetin dioxygenase-like cupin family protein